MEETAKLNSFKLIQILIGGSRINQKFMVIADSSKEENQLPCWLILGHALLTMHMVHLKLVLINLA